MTADPAQEHEDGRDDLSSSETPIASAPSSRRSVRVETAKQAKPTRSNTPQPPTSTPSRLQDELALLSPANTALRTDPAKALELLRSHEARFPDSDLWDLRESAKVTALCRLGRVEAARAEVAVLGASRSVPTAVRSALRSCEVTDNPEGGHSPS